MIEYRFERGVAVFVKLREDKKRPNSIRSLVNSLLNSCSPISVVDVIGAGMSGDVGALRRRQEMTENAARDFGISMHQLPDVARAPMPVQYAPAPPGVAPMPVQYAPAPHDAARLPVQYAPAAPATFPRSYMPQDHGMAEENRQSELLRELGLSPRGPGLTPQGFSLNAHDPGMAAGHHHQLEMPHSLGQALYDPGMPAPHGLSLVPQNPGMVDEQEYDPEQPSYNRAKPTETVDLAALAGLNKAVEILKSNS